MYLKKIKILFIVFFFLSLSCNYNEDLETELFDKEQQLYKTQDKLDYCETEIDILTSENDELKQKLALAESIIDILEDAGIIINYFPDYDVKLLYSPNFSLEKYFNPQYFNFIQDKPIKPKKYKSHLPEELLKKLDSLKKNNP